MTGERRGATNVTVSDDNYGPKALLRMGRIGRELRLTDQMLSDDLDTVTIAESGPAAAWTSLDGSHVTFNMARMPQPDSALDVAVWLGTNAHELGHVIFTPREDSTLMRRVASGDKSLMPKLHRLWNVLEDQRQERLLLARFDPWVTYLKAALGHHLRADGHNAWLLMCGRTWLPDDVRAQARAAFLATGRSDAIADQVADLVGEYQRLLDPGEADNVEAWELMERLYAIFADDLPELPPTCSVMGEGEPDTSAPKGEPWATADADPNPSAGGGDTDDGDDAAGDGDGDGEGDGDGDDGDDDVSGRGAASGSSGAGQQSGQFDNASAKRQLKADAKREIEHEPEQSGEVKDVMDALDYGRPGDEAVGEPSEGLYRDASDAAFRLSHEVGDALLELQAESDPGWERYVDSGRLKPIRLLAKQVDPERIFDRFSPGRGDATDVELVVLLDVSGSMSQKMVQLGESAWAIRRAVDDVEGRSTVMTYDTEFWVMSQPHERPDLRMFVPKAMGGTEPSSALRQAHRLLAESEKRIRLMMVLTDGDWDTPSKAERYITAMREEGIVTVLAYLDTSGGRRIVSRINAHGCDLAEQIDDPHGLALLFRKVAVELMRQR